MNPWFSRVVTAASLIGIAAVGQSSAADATAVPRFDHVVVVLFENHADTHRTWPPLPRRAPT